jgi:hypothetical protein
VSPPGAEIRVSLILASVSATTIIRPAVQGGKGRVETAFRLPNVAIREIAERGDLVLPRSAPGIHRGLDEAIGYERLGVVEWIENVARDEHERIVESNGVSLHVESEIDRYLVGRAIGELAADSAFIGRIRVRQRR